MRSGASTPKGVPGRAAFTLVELLVVISIILVLMGLIGSAVSAARGSQRVQATQALITKLDRVVQQHYSSYASRPVPGATSAADRGTFLRRLASVELPDNWVDVQAINGGVSAFGTGTALLPRTAPQSAYAGLLASSTVAPTAQFADAECLFMIVMMGGVADCLDCDALGTSQMGDTDNDGAFEFLDAWGNPIRYVLWPAKLELPPGSGNFFSATAPFSSDPLTANAGRTMRPLIFSGGPDKTNAILVNAGGNLAAGASCGVPSSISAGGLDTSGRDARADNITNFDAEARK
jgi:prepilin-type N-terminal cleavage/methylation domain-containing protein